MPTVKSTDETFEKMIKDNKVVVTDFGHHGVIHV